MTTLIALIGALSLAAVPLLIGWRRTAGEAEMARALGLSPPKRRFDPHKVARQTGTGLTARQLSFGFAAWTGGGLVCGGFFGPVGAALFALGAALLYITGLAARREDLRMAQAKDILRALGVIETLLTQGRSLADSIAGAAGATGPQGTLVLNDLVVRMRSAPVEAQAEAVRGWTEAWDSPAVDLVGTALLAALQGRIEIAPLVAALRGTLSGVVEILSRARSAAKGVEWQARFLAVFPPSVLVAIAATTPETGRLYAADPALLLPVLLGSGVSYLLSMRMIRKGLSMDASLGLGNGTEGLIRFDRMGKVL
ncbi:MAG TPA: hypothetical protein VMN57_01460 [Anaerolineales bacterium]|nr:hypothetical protein [Anaerolineales bacterium]